jgi:uncharacterized glyoxalase superfamily protein PhnB
MFNRSAPPGTIVPSLCYADVEKAAAWLCDTFGFVERLRWGGDAAQPSVELVLGQAAIFVRGPAASRSPDDPPFRPPAPDGRSHSIMVGVDDVDAHYQRACDRGATITLPIQTYAFGERQYSAVDLDGHRWCFTQSVGDVDPHDWGAQVADDRG